jgi:hypothetical protein
METQGGPEEKPGLEKHFYNKETKYKLSKNMKRKNDMKGSREFSFYSDWNGGCQQAV